MAESETDIFFEKMEILQIAYEEGKILEEEYETEKSKIIAWGKEIFSDWDQYERKIIRRFEDMEENVKMRLEDEEEEKELDRIAKNMTGKINAILWMLLAIFGFSFCGGG